MNIVDVIIILLILSWGVIGLKRGILKELVIVVGTILVFIIAFILKDYLAAFLCEHLPFFHFAKSLGGINSLSILFYQLISFLLIVIALQFILRILISISGILGKILDATIILALPNRILGFIVGLVEGYIIMFIALNILAIPLKENQIYVDSNVREKIMMDTPILSKNFGGINQALNDILALNGKDANTNNLAVIDTLLKYNVVTTEFIENLLTNNKLTQVIGVEEIINKYK